MTLTREVARADELTALHAEAKRRGVETRKVQRVPDLSGYVMEGMCDRHPLDIAHDLLAKLPSGWVASYRDGRSVAYLPKDRLVGIKTGTFVACVTQLSQRLPL